MENTGNIDFVNGITEHTKPAPFVLTIASGKGGVGKSVLAANIANCLSDDLCVLVWDAICNSLTNTCSWVPNRQSG